MSISDFSIRKPKTVLIFTIILVALGLYTLNDIAINLLPDFSLPYIMVITQEPNASPEEIEQRVTKTMEGTFAGITGLTKITSSSNAGSSVITLQFSQSTDLNQATNMIRDKLSLVEEYLPSDAAKPMIMQLDVSLMPVIGVSLTGNKTPDELLNIANDLIKPALEQLEGVASASISGGREKVIKIELPIGTLDTFGLSLTQMSGIIASQNWKSDAGIIKDKGINYSISSEGNFNSIQDIKDTIITTKSDSKTGTVSVITLGDIANVYEDYKDPTSYSYINGVPGITLTLQKQSGTNSLQVVNKVHAKMEELNKTLPTGVKLDEAFNTTDSISTSISNVTTSAILGAILAVLVILLFLRSISSTLIISLTIPISLIVTLLVMRFTGKTINMMSLAGLTLGVGMLVDNSIVILENIFSYREKGAKPHIAASLGANEMKSAITSSTLTTICVFLPLLLFRNSLNGVITIFEDLAFTVIISLLSSLLVALILVPTLSSSFFTGHIKRVGEKRTGLNGLIERMFLGLESGYSKFIRWCLHHKFLFVAIILILLALSVVQIQKLGFIFMPKTDQTSVTATLQFPYGTELTTIDETTKKVEGEIEKNLQGYKTISASVDGGSIRSIFFGGSGSKSTITITLKDAKTRATGDMTATQTVAIVDTISKEYTGVDISTDGATINPMSSIGGNGSDIDITLKSNDFNRLTAVSNEIVNLLETQGSDYVNNVDNSIKEGNPQLSLIFDKADMNKNYMNSLSVAKELKADLTGVTVGSYTSSGDDIDMVLSLSDADQYHKFNIDQIYVTNALGTKVPLSAFAHFEETTSSLTISREAQGRVAHITASNVGNLSINNLNDKVEQLLVSNIPTDENLSYSVGGAWDQMKEGIDVFIKIILMASILVFAVMASQFESFKDPFIVIFTLPMALIGIVGILTLMNTVISIMSLVGALVLVGIIVNNGIVLVDYTNLLRKRGYTLENACAEAARTRLRPILMTTLTTVLALVPLTFFPTEGSQLIQPIGQVIFGGLSFGTLMTLTMMPIIYYIFNSRDEKKKIKKTKENKSKYMLLSNENSEENKGDDK
ncbi:MAG: efflux RND transporter permease subunit [Spirochaetaceae bacterium]|nr:efflux RND transporter permease subunit [Spirochaetaceae bacterium]